MSAKPGTVNRQPSTVSTWEQAETMLGEIAVIEASARQLVAETDQEISGIRANLKERLDEIAATRVRLESALEGFVREHIAEEAPAKSKRLRAMNETPLQPVPDGGQCAAPGAQFCDEQERRLMIYLDRHRGRARAIKLLDLSRATDITVREIQIIVAHLVEHHGIPIGGCHRGLYMIETAEELNEVCTTLKHRALATLKHMAALKKQHLDALLGQLRLDLAHHRDTGED